MVKARASAGRIALDPDRPNGPHVPVRSVSRIAAGLFAENQVDHQVEAALQPA